MTEEQKQVLQIIDRSSEDFAKMFHKVGDTNFSFEQKKNEINFFLTSLCKLYKLAFKNENNS